jgi:glutamine synthetase
MNPYIAIAALCGAFLAGWTASDWHSDSLDLVATKAAQASADAAQGRESAVAQTVETALAKLRANEKVIYRESVKLIDRPVYHNVCLDADGLRLANAAKNGTEPVVTAPAVPRP